MFATLSAKTSPFIGWLVLFSSVCCAADDSYLPGAWNTQQVRKSKITGTFVRATPAEDDPTDPAKMTSYKQTLPFVDRQMTEKYLFGWYGWRDLPQNGTKSGNSLTCQQEKDIHSKVDTAQIFIKKYQTGGFACLPDKGNAPELGRVRLLCTPSAEVGAFFRDPLNSVVHMHVAWTFDVRSASSLRVREDSRIDALGLVLENDAEVVSTRLGSCEDFPEAKKIVDTPAPK